MLTEQELNKIFSWLPYRSDWPINRNQKDDNINGYYGDLIAGLKNNKLFDAYFSQDGGLSNYLEFVCYPPNHQQYEGNAIIVCVSLCAPIAAYGQAEFLKKSDMTAWDFLTIDMLNKVTDRQLKKIETEVLDLLSKKSLSLIEKEFASMYLPLEIVEGLKGENHNVGNQYLQGIFQVTD